MCVWVEWCVEFSGRCGMASFSQEVLNQFEAHASKMREHARARREAVQLRSVVDDTADAVALSVWDTLGVRQDSDRWTGCTNLRTLRTLLSIIDGARAKIWPPQRRLAHVVMLPGCADRGFERSPHQACRPVYPSPVYCSRVLARR